jgi:sulfur relay (sulfurtransferase) complex TusBCD TusD component (DsrE family)
VAQEEVVGTLLITYAGGQDQQPIRWVKLTDFTNLQKWLDIRADHAQHAQFIRAQITALRQRGVTDEQMATSGMDVAQFERMATADGTWSLISYQRQQDPVTGDYLRINRVHQLQTNTITGIKLVNRQTVRS